VHRLNLCPNNTTVRIIIILCKYHLNTIVNTIQYFYCLPVGECTVCRAVGSTPFGNRNTSAPIRGRTRLRGGESRRDIASSLASVGNGKASGRWHSVGCGGRLSRRTVADRRVTGADRLPSLRASRPSSTPCHWWGGRSWRTRASGTSSASGSGSPSPTRGRIPVPSGPRCRRCSASSCGRR